MRPAAQRGLRPGGKSEWGKRNKAWGNNEKGATRRLRMGFWTLINRDRIRMFYDSKLQP